MSYIGNVEIRLFITVEYNGKSENLCIPLKTETDVHTQISEILNSTVPGCRLPGKGSMHFISESGALVIQTSTPLTVNGVALTRRTLKESDRIIFGDSRIIFHSFEACDIRPVTPADSTNRKPGIDFIEKIIRTLLSNPRRIRTAGIAATITAACIIAGCLALPGPVGTVNQPKKTPDHIEAAEPAAQTSLPPEADADGTEAQDDTAETSGIILVEPGDQIPETDLDILFIHAHPDDESLDFGCLLALCEAAGLKTGLITFTDGEAGLDLYPGRKTGGLYPDHYLEGTELSSVRIVELEKAAGRLGVDLLIRLGLKNHPYNSISDELSAEQVLEEWGGEASLAERLRNIILLTHPETVAAPEGPGRAREHFEHEAVGYITAEVMFSFEADDYRSPRRFLTCIDPRQHYLYPEAVSINAGATVSGASVGSRVSLRQVQLEALLNHRTQNDAVNVGSGFLPKYPSEYYRIQYWRSNRSWEDLALNELP